MRCLQPTVLKAAVLSITLSALLCVFCCDFSLHSFLKPEILHAFAEAAGAEEVAVTVLPPISVAQQEWSLRVKLDLQVLQILGQYSLLQNKTSFLEDLRQRNNYLPR